MTKREITLVYWTGQSALAFAGYFAFHNFMRRGQRPGILADLAFPVVCLLILWWAAFHRYQNSRSRKSAVVDTLDGLMMFVAILGIAFFAFAYPWVKGGG